MHLKRRMNEIHDWNKHECCTQCGLSIRNAPEQCPGVFDASRDAKIRGKWLREILEKASKK